MGEVKVTCRECDGEGTVSEIRHPAGGYSDQTEPSYSESSCDTCGGDGKETITRAEHLERSLIKMEANKKAKAEALRKALDWAAKVAELV